MSSSVLYERINELRDAKLLDQQDDGEYALTQLGRDLGDAIAPLQRWAERWSTSTTSRGRR
jgi:DNA-binding HxlR family transcriptional regulator